MAAGIQIDLISREKLGEMSPQERIRFIVDEIKAGKVLVLERGLTAKEELELIRVTMDEIDHESFIGVETPGFSVDLKKQGFMNRLLGRKPPPRMMVVGPAHMLQTIKKDGEMVQAMIVTKESMGQITMDQLPPPPDDWEGPEAPRKEEDEEGKVPKEVEEGAEVKELEEGAEEKEVEEGAEGKEDGEQLPEEPEGGGGETPADGEEGSGEEVGPPGGSEATAAPSGPREQADGDGEMEGGSSLPAGEDSDTPLEPDQEEPAREEQAQEIPAQDQPATEEPPSGEGPAEPKEEPKEEKPRPVRYHSLSKYPEEPQEEGEEGEKGSQEEPKEEEEPAEEGGDQ